MLEAEPEAVVSDKHPMYNTVSFAEEYAKEHNVPLVQIQHHYAHILSCMAENGYDGKAIGLSLDGTGYGDDGTIWGGEILLSDYSGFERKGSIKPFIQVGGDASAKEGWRIAAAMLRDCFGEDGNKVCRKLGICSEKEYSLISMMADKHINSVVSTSCGRLFDAVSAILGIRRASTYEGDASTALMYHAQLFEKELGDKEFKCGYTGRHISENNGYITLETDALVKYIAEQLLDNSSPDINRLAYEFHYALSDMLIKASERVRELCGIDTAALSGGVFQNKLLVRLTNEGLKSRGFKVLLHSLVPPNDGGIALGQAAYAVKQR